MKRKFNCWGLLLLLPCLSLANDSALVLTPEAYMQIVKNYHPVARQADLIIQRSKAEVLQARGGFDPILQSGIEEKDFGGKDYYQYLNAGVSIPTWYGVELTGGIAEVTGERVSEESTLGQTTYIGLKIPVNNLVFDARRAVLQQARAIVSLSEAERIVAVNNLLFDALNAYWNWVREYQLYNLSNELIRINEERLRFLRIEFEQGARPAIDTTETLAQLQQIQAQQQAAWISYRNAGLELSNYLWLESGQPAEWDVRITPDSKLLDFDYSKMIRPEVERLIAEARSNHPKLRSIAFKITSLEIERRLKGQYFLPKISLQANYLTSGYALPKEPGFRSFDNNHEMKLGVQFPLFLREARGAYRSIRFKIQETGLERDLTLLEIENKIRSYANEIEGLLQQLRVFEQANLNYIRLYQGERTRFEIGESSLFLLNARENKVLETRQKLVELKTKWHKSMAGLLAAAGILLSN